MEAEPEYLFPTYTLEWYEYIVFGLVLAASLGIGIFYGFFGTKNKTNEEFLMAGRSMGILPVTLSLLCSFVSAITLLGNPVEIYFYGGQFTLVIFAYIPMTLALAYLYVPVYFDLQLTSAYEYFEWRFSSSARTLLSILAMGQLIIYMPTVVWGPSLALDQVAGIDPYFSAAAIFIVCIAYSSVGGLKAVLWTDALQAIVMVGSLLAVVGLGVYELGGFDKIWETAKAAERAQFFNFDVDPRTRHTVFTTLIGGYFLWLPLFAATQAQIQRYNSVPTLRQSRQCLLFNLCGLFLVVLLCSFIGLMIFATFAECDPVKSKRVTSPDQLFPLFVMDVLSKYSGLPGLLVAGLTCASLSTVSSALNSMAAIIVEDFVKWAKPGLSEIQLGFASKIVSVVSGVLAFGLVFIIAIVNKTVQIQPFASMMIATLYGPILGAFTMGMIFPWVNNIGILCGIISSMLVTGTVSLGSIIAGIEGLIFNQRLSLTTEGCNETALPESAIFRPDHVHIPVPKLVGWNSAWKNETSSFTRDLWNVSYMYQPAIGALTTMIVGLLVSFVVILLTSSKGRARVNHSLMSKPFLRFWTWIFGERFMNKWVDYDSPPFRSGKKKTSNGHAQAQNGNGRNGSVAMTYLDWKDNNNDGNGSSRHQSHRF